MTSTEILEKEHHLVLSFLKGARDEVQQIRSTGEVNIRLMGTMIEFFKIFTDGNHHAKEEQLLFPKMIERGAWKDGPIAAMYREHEEGRRLIRAMSEDLDRYNINDSTATNDLCDHLLRYIDLMWWHIQKENTIVFDIAERILTFSDQNELCINFQALDSQTRGENAFGRYSAFAQNSFKENNKPKL
jgi:hemerythrin-like domain-containing protein